MEAGLVMKKEILKNLIIFSTENFQFVCRYDCTLRFENKCKTLPLVMKSASVPNLHKKISTMVYVNTYTLITVLIDKDSVNRTFCAHLSIDLCFKGPLVIT